MKTLPLLFLACAAAMSTQATSAPRAAADGVSGVTAAQGRRFELVAAARPGTTGRLRPAPASGASLDCRFGLAPEVVTFTGLQGGLQPSAASCPQHAARSSDRRLQVAGRTLAFDTAPLRQTMTSRGVWSVQLFARAPDGSVVVAVQDVGPRGAALVALKAVRLSPSGATSRLTAGAYEVELGPVDHAFPAGHRIRLTFATASDNATRIALADDPGRPSTLLAALR